MAFKSAPLEMGGRCDKAEELISEWERARLEANSWQFI
jgi:hypothetical protein